MMLECAKASGGDSTAGSSVAIIMVTTWSLNGVNGGMIGNMVHSDALPENQLPYQMLTERVW